MTARTALRINRRLVWGLLLACWLLTPGVQAQAQAAVQDPDRAQQLRVGMDLAKKEGAKGQLPQAWWDLGARLDDAEKNGATESQWLALETDVQRLRNAAAFVARMRKSCGTLSIA